MARRKEAGTLKLGILSAALIGGLALPAQAEELTLGASATLTTDYVFRGISQTAQDPAVQASLDASYGVFYLGAWGSNVDFGGNDVAPFQELATVEIDYYAGIAPTWQGISFDIGGIYYTYPGAFDPDGEFDYFELKTGASYTFGDAFTVGITNYWSPEFFGETGDADALEVGGEYAFSGQLFNFFSPSVSGLVGWQWIDEGTDYTYWNVGLTLGFMDNWAADVRYWDTDISEFTCGGPFCDERVVGTITASF